MTLNVPDSQDMFTEAKGLQVMCAEGPSAV